MKVYNVSQINTYVKQIIESDYHLFYKINVEGEASNVKVHHTGNIYFTLKDKETQIKCVMFNVGGKKLNIKIEDGIKLIVTAKLQVYEKGGTYQLNVQDVKKVGKGDLNEEFLALKEKLEKEGLFDEINKQALPKYAMKVGIVTSRDGDAIRDIEKISRARNPYVELYLYNALVQGERASKSIIAGIEALDRKNLDVIIIGRGGGSIEDLWAFNDEELAKAIFYAKTPIISAVGHETDYTIADFVADKRASTPTQAAELANFEYDDFISQVRNFQNYFKLNINSKIDRFKNITQDYLLRLSRYSPAERISSYRLKVLNLDTAMEKSIKYKLIRTKTKIRELAIKMESLSPLKLLENGYAYISNEEGIRVTSKEEIKKDDILNISLKDGKVKAKVIESEI